MKFKTTPTGDVLTQIWVSHKDFGGAGRPVWGREAYPCGDVFWVVEGDEESHGVSKGDRILTDVRGGLRIFLAKVTRDQTLVIQHEHECRCHCR